MWLNIAEYLYFESYHCERLKSCRNSVFATLVAAYRGSFLTLYSDIPPFVPRSHNVFEEYVLSFKSTPPQEENMSQIGRKKIIKKYVLFFPATNSGTGYSLRNLAGRLLWQSSGIVKRPTLWRVQTHITPHISYYEGKHDTECIPFIYLEIVRFVF